MTSDAPSPAPRPCAICGKPVQTAFRPFCSRRCKDVDLHRWLAGSYVVPASDPEDDEDAPIAPR
jgi:endogenous inhibitor of DNA gyrase (YacG/DUF329 family)